MARFKFVRVARENGKSIVRVQKVHFKIKPRSFVIALICAVLVWLYVKGTALKLQQPSVDTPTPETTAAETLPSDFLCLPEKGA